MASTTLLRRLILAATLTTACATSPPPPSRPLELPPPDVQRGAPPFYGEAPSRRAGELLGDRLTLNERFPDAPMTVYVVVRDEAGYIDEEAFLSGVTHAWGEGGPLRPVMTRERASALLAIEVSPHIVTAHPRRPMVLMIQGALLDDEAQLLSAVADFPMLDADSDVWRTTLEEVKHPGQRIGSVAVKAASGLADRNEALCLGPMAGGVDPTTRPFALEHMEGLLSSRVATGALGDFRVVLDPAYDPPWLRQELAELSRARGTTPRPCQHRIWTALARATHQGPNHIALSFNGHDWFPLMLPDAITRAPRFGALLTPQETTTLEGQPAATHLAIRAAIDAERFGLSD